MLDIVIYYFLSTNRQSLFNSVNFREMIIDVSCLFANLNPAIPSTLSDYCIGILILLKPPKSAIDPCSNP